MYTQSRCPNFSKVSFLAAEVTFVGLRGGGRRRGVTRSMSSGGTSAASDTESLRASPPTTAETLCSCAMGALACAWRPFGTAVWIALAGRGPRRRVPSRPQDRVDSGLRPPTRTMLRCDLWRQSHTVSESPSESPSGACRIFGQRSLGSIRRQCYAVILGHVILADLESSATAR